MPLHLFFSQNRNISLLSTGHHNFLIEATTFKNISKNKSCLLLKLLYFVFLGQEYYFYYLPMEEDRFLKMIF